MAARLAALEAQCDELLTDVAALHHALDATRGHPVPTTDPVDRDSDRADRARRPLLGPPRRGEDLTARLVGANAVVHPDVRIGDGAVVGSGSVVLQDVRE